MNSQSDEHEKKQIVFVPNNSDANVPGSILSVELDEGEEVEWLWTHLENGKSAVTGYTIIKKDDSN
ncbi:hypothetical protein ACQKP8_26285 [Photobacterium alginatilyticum]|uniref:hypothetical protein n=1 Tax=Photobacterium alginatilyticum TaxID=1775171 RepID=UPI0040686F22